MEVPPSLEVFQRRLLQGNQPGTFDKGVELKIVRGLPQDEEEEPRPLNYTWSVTEYEDQGMVL